MSKKEKINELIFGVHPVLELLKAKRRSLVTIYTTKPAPKAWDLIEPLLSRSVQLQYVSRDILTRMAQTTDHQGVVAWATPFVYRAKPFDIQRQPFLVMLDGIQDPRNLGAIIRSAYCIGIDGIVLCKKSSAPLTSAALKASAGLAEHMQIYQSPSPLAAAQELKKAGYALYLATLDGTDATKIAYTEPLCMVIGSEGKGVSSEILKTGQHVTLPQRRSDISYNASVAAGILLFTIGQQLKKLAIDSPISV